MKICIYLCISYGSHSEASLKRLESWFFFVAEKKLGHMALVRATRRNIPEDGILHSHRRETLKSYEKQYVSSEVQIEFYYIL
jgi:hypothetical protein